MGAIGKLLFMEQTPDRAADRKDEPDDFFASVQDRDCAVDSKNKGKTRFEPAWPMMLMHLNESTEIVYPENK